MLAGVKEEGMNHVEVFMEAQMSSVFLKGATNEHGFKMNKLFCVVIILLGSLQVTSPVSLLIDRQTCPNLVAQTSGQD